VNEKKSRLIACKPWLTYRAYIVCFNALAASCSKEFNMLFYSYIKQVFEIKNQTLQVPRMPEGLQSCTNNLQQTIQEPVPGQVMVPQIQTVNSIQQIQEVVEYTLTPIYPHIVTGPTYTQPVAPQTYTAGSCDTRAAAVNSNVNKSQMSAPFRRVVSSASAYDHASTAAATFATSIKATMSTFSNSAPNLTKIFDHLSFSASSNITPSTEARSPNQTPTCRSVSFLSQKGFKYIFVVVALVCI